jgi:hypothetical protein
VDTTYSRFALFMPLSSSTEPALPAAWTQVLEQIQQVLAEALRAAEERARALDAPGSEEEAGNHRDLNAVVEALASPAESAPLSQETIAEAEQALAVAQAALDRWLAAAAQVGQRLAEQAARAV